MQAFALHDEGGTLMFHPIQHFKTITHHRQLVFRHCMKAGILWQGLVHDLSKYSPTEFIPGARYYLGYKSPNVLELAVHGPGCTIRAATNIILNIG